MTNELIEYLKVQTAFFDFGHLSENFTAKKMAEVFEVKRNTISQRLNQAVQDGDIIKIVTRPVYFLHKEAFESQFYSLGASNIFKSLEELRSYKPKFQRKEDIFSLIIGYDNSLARSIEQMKTAAIYPNGDLPIILTGESGTGKSYMVQIYHKFCLEEGLIDEEAPLVTFNCAQYANNPELLTSNLFGYKKGAFTGAAADYKGAFEEADEGILFLDEVHRLPPEGQEKLFTYLDEKIIYPVGETRKGKKVSVRLAFATTEELTSNFLVTFLRRIPIQIELPNLGERTSSERQELIYTFIIKEAKKINKAIEVSAALVNLLKGQSFKGNIGDLKNTIKYAVARAYSRQTDKEKIELTIYDLPVKALNTTNNFLMPSNDGTKITLSKYTDIHQLRLKKNKSQKAITYTYDKLLSIYSAGGSASWDKMGDLVDRLLDTLLFETRPQNNQELFEFITHFVKEVIQSVESMYQIKFQGNSVYAISYYLFYRSNIHWECEDDSIRVLMEEMSRDVSETYRENYNLAFKTLEMIGKKLDLEVFEMDVLIFSLYFDKLSLKKTSNNARAVIIAHGYSTASSIANVANRMLNMNVFEAFDMPLDTSTSEIINQVISYAQEVDISNGLVILVDMGSLKDIYKSLDSVITAPVTILNNVTTQIALSVGEKIMKELPIESMMEKIIEENKLNYEVIYPVVQKPKVIISSCITGIGTARKIMNLLEKSLPADLAINILSYDFDKLAIEKEKLLSLYNVIGIIGTADPMLKGIPFISVEEIITGEGLTEMNKLFSKEVEEQELVKINNDLIKNFSLETVIDSVTILDTEKILEKIEIFIGYFENLENIKIENGKKIAVYVHISCLVERLIRNIPITTYKDLTLLKQSQENSLKNIKQAFSVIESYYSVEIPDEELGYIYDLMFRKTDTSMEEANF